MSTQTQARAEAALPELEAVTAVVLPEPAPPVAPLAEAAPPVAEEIRRRMAEIDLSDTTSIVHFGSRAQSGLQEISQSMLADVKNKDSGNVGDMMTKLIGELEGFENSTEKPKGIRGWEDLLGDGSVRRLHLTIGDVNASFERSGKPSVLRTLES